MSETDQTLLHSGTIFRPGWLANKLDGLIAVQRGRKTTFGADSPQNQKLNLQCLENGVNGQLRLGLRSFLVRSRRGSVVGGGLHLFFCVCWVFQGRITLGWRGLSMATSP